MRPLVLLFVLSIAATILVFPACQPATDGGGDGGNGGGGEQPDATDQLITLVAPESNPVLAALAGNLGSVSGDDFVLDDYEGVEDAVAGAQAIGVDAGQIDPDTAGDNPFLTAARRTGTPVVWVDDQADAAGRQGEDQSTQAMANAFGLGVDGTAVVVSTTDPQYSGRRSVRQDTSDPEHGLAFIIDVVTPTAPDSLDAPTTEDEVPEPEETEDPGEPYPDPEPKAEEENPDAPAASDTPELTPTETAQAIQDVLEGADAALASVRDLAAPIPADCPYRTWFVNHSWTWTPGGRNQTHSISIDWVFQLFASSNPYNKFLRILSLGAGSHPGSLLWNERTDRGYYQDRLSLWMGPSGDALPSGFTLLDHDPPNANNQGSWSSSTGFTIGFTAGADTSGPQGSVNGSYSATQTETLNLTEFQLVNNTNNQRAQFDIMLSMAEGNAITEWKNIIKEACFGQSKVRNLPSMATGNIAPRCQVVYRSDGGETRNLPFYVKAEQQTRDTWFSEAVWCTDMMYTRSYTSTSSKTVYVNFATVDD